MGVSDRASKTLLRIFHHCANNIATSKESDLNSFLVALSDSGAIGNDPPVQKALLLISSLRRYLGLEFCAVIFLFLFVVFAAIPARVHLEKLMRVG